MNVLVSENLYDREFVGRHGHGFDKFAAEIKAYTPSGGGRDGARGEPDPRHRARVRPPRPHALIHPGRRVNWNGDDAQRSRAIALANALLGNWGRRGGIYLNNNVKLASYPLPKYPTSEKPAADNPNYERYPFAHEAVTTASARRR